MTKAADKPMHELVRQVRFSVNPFLSDTPAGSNSYCSKPAGSGLSIYLALWVHLKGPADPQTGFVVNVSDIDKTVREHLVPVYTSRIVSSFTQARHVTTEDIVDMLIESFPILASQFSGVEPVGLTLELNPFRKISVSRKDTKVYLYSEKFEFAAMHTLWNDKFSPEKNLQVFGKCANKAGHGHNYILEVTVELPQSPDRLFANTDFEDVVSRKLIDLVDHKNLNVDVEGFSMTVPTVENIAGFAWKKLTGQFPDAKLKSVTVWENDRTYCRYEEQ